MENNVIVLSEEQRSELEKYVNTGVHSVHLVKRARVILSLQHTSKTRRHKLHEAAFGAFKRTTQEITENNSS